MTNIISKNKLFNKRAFSLTENLTVIFVLGLIIGITIPNMVKQRTIKQNKIAVRKALMEYHSLLRKNMSNYSGITTTADLNKIITNNENNCSTLKKNFLISSHTDCNFVTQDGMRWNATNPDKVIIGLKNKKLTGANIYKDLTLANAALDSNSTVFVIPYDIKCENDGLGKTCNIQMLSSSDNGASIPAAITKTKNFIASE